MQNEIKKLYREIQKLLIGLVPENWNSIILYASVFNGKNGEMFFYYFPKKIIKTKPVNCYEIPSKFGIDDNTYNEGLTKLYSYIKKLNKYGYPKWTNLTIEIKNNTFTIEYKFNDLINSPYNDEQRRLVWSYKYLNIPLESMSLKDRVLIETYKEDSNIRPTVYSEVLNLEKTKEKVKDDTIENESNNSTKINPILKY